jgi:hypothetical protein
MVWSTWYSTDMIGLWCSWWGPFSQNPWLILYHLKVWSQAGRNIYLLHAWIYRSRHWWYFACRPPLNNSDGWGSDSLSVWEKWDSMHVLMMTEASLKHKDTTYAGGDSDWRKMLRRAEIHDACLAKPVWEVSPPNNLAERLGTGIFFATPEANMPGIKGFSRYLSPPGNAPHLVTSQPKKITPMLKSS